MRDKHCSYTRRLTDYAVVVVLDYVREVKGALQSKAAAVQPQVHTSHYLSGRDGNETETYWLTALCKLQGSIVQLQETLKLFNIHTKSMTQEQVTGTSLSVLNF